MRAEVIAWTFGAFAMHLMLHQQEPSDRELVWAGLAFVAGCYHDARWLCAARPDRLAN